MRHDSRPSPQGSGLFICRARVVSLYPWVILSNSRMTRWAIAILYLICPIFDNSVSRRLLFSLLEGVVGRASSIGKGQALVIPILDDDCTACSKEHLGSVALAVQPKPQNKHIKSEIHELP